LEKATACAGGPVAVGRGSGGHIYDIDPGKATSSILIFRMKSQDPGIMMPELGRSLVHSEAVTMLEAWTDQLVGSGAVVRRGSVVR
tara:strand:- start:216 stop:473 length:258 start_codon:yes stop_codon:yes gene_type:complete